MLTRRELIRQGAAGAFAIGMGHRISRPDKRPVPPGTVLFVDDFNGAAGAPPDPAKWWATPWAPGGQTTTHFEPGNCYQDGLGNLVLRVNVRTKDTTAAYDGGRIQTFREGSWPPPQVLAQVNAPCRIEARARFAPGLGLWGGIWTNANTDSAHNLELDLQEFRGKYPTTDSVHTHIIKEYGTSFDTGLDLTQAFHLYWCEYRSTGVVFGFDSITVGQTSLPAAPPQLLRLSHEVGAPGTWGGDGGPPDPSRLPADMLVDYIRVTTL